MNKISAFILTVIALLNLILVYQIVFGGADLVYIKPLYKETEIYVTGYNTVPEQTDDTPCIAANGMNICGIENVAACPRDLPFGTLIEIDGVGYKCFDRIGEQYQDRIDISCDKDFECPPKVTGWHIVKIYYP